MSAKTSNLIPAAIILAGLVLAIAIYSVRHVDGPSPADGDITKVLPVGADDHVMGNPEAKVTVITYSDIDCQFCKRFHEVMEQVMADYGADGDVAYVLRHFPIIDLHPYSGTHAKAAECAADLGGPELFWRFIGALHTSAPGAEPFNPQGYAAVAGSLGLDGGALVSCAQSSKFEDRVARDFENGLVIGAEGTPFTVILAEGFEPAIVSGYVPYEGMKTVIDGILEKL